MQQVHIFTDGSCDTLSRLGGWASIMTLPEANIEHTLYGSESETTNNRMELEGVIQAFKSLKNLDKYEFHLHTDSTYVLGALTNGHSWLLKKKLPNRDKVIELLEIQAELQSQGANITIHKVEAHKTGDKSWYELMNTEADKRAVSSRKKQLPFGKYISKGGMTHAT